MARKVVSFLLFRHHAKVHCHRTTSNHTTAPRHFSDGSEEIALISYDRNLVANFDVKLEINTHSL